MPILVASCSVDRRIGFSLITALTSAMFHDEGRGVDEVKTPPFTPEQILWIDRLVDPPMTSAKESGGPSGNPAPSTLETTVSQPGKYIRLWCKGRRWEVPKRTGHRCVPS